MDHKMNHTMNCDLSMDMDMNMMGGGMMKVSFNQREDINFGISSLFADVLPF